MDNKFIGIIIIFALSLIAITAVGLSLDEPDYETTISTAAADQTTLAAIQNFVPTEESETPSDFLPSVKEYTMAQIDYLDDALFIGDSRTVGLESYSDIDNADFFCTVGMNVFKIFNEKANVKGVSTDLRSLLISKKYGKIYIMLGINELGYNRNTAFSKYKELISVIEELQSDAYIFLQANIHVGAERSAKDSIINNAGINEFNSMIATLENKQNIFYIDVNGCFDDENGNLSTTYSSDGIHLYASYFNLWKDFILTKAIY